MARDAVDALSRALDAPIPPEFEALSDEQLHALAATVVAACEHRTEALSTAITALLRHIPALLRPAVKKALGL